MYSINRKRFSTVTEAATLILCRYTAQIPQSTYIYNLAVLKKYKNCVYKRWNFFVGYNKQCLCIIMKAPVFYFIVMMCISRQPSMDQKGILESESNSNISIVLPACCTLCWIWKGMLACFQTTPASTVYCMCVHSTSCKLYVLTNHIWGFKTYNWSKREGLIHFPLNWLAKTTKTKW